MLNTHWDTVNKWLYFGNKEGQNNQFTILFDNWYWISRVPTIRQWKLFEIMWDNGAFWAGDLTETEEITIPRMNGKYIENDEIVKRSGILDCFVQITIVGIGFRYWYERGMEAYSKKFKEKNER